MIKIKNEDYLDKEEEEEMSGDKDDHRELRARPLIGQSKEKILIIKCGDGSRLGLLEIQPENKKVMTVKAFLNGFKGKRFSMRWLAASEALQQSAS